MLRQLDNGTIITRVNSPLGEGHIYYVCGGPEGNIQIIDTYLIDPAIISACLAWEMDIPKETAPERKNKPINPRIPFNKTGFAF